MNCEWHEDRPAVRVYDPPKHWRKDKPNGIGLCAECSAYMDKPDACEHGMVDDLVDGSFGCIRCEAKAGVNGFRPEDEKSDFGGDTPYEPQYNAANPRKNPTYTFRVL